MTDAYDPATRPCAPGPMPGCTALQHAILGFWPKTTDVGTFVCRNNADDAPSVHGNGRAGDIGCRGALGQEIADWLVANHTVLGVQLVIWNHRIWNVSIPGGWRPYGCDKPGSKKDHHTTHIHYELNVDAGKRLTPGIIDGVLPHQSPQPEPPEPEDEQMLIYFSEEDNEGLEIASDHGNLTGIPDERTRNSLLKAGFKKVVVSKDFFALLKKKTTL